MSEWTVPLLGLLTLGLSTLVLTVLYAYRSKLLWTTTLLGEISPLENIPTIRNPSRINFNKFHLFLQAHSRNLGGVYRVQLCGKDIVVLNSYDAIYEALVEKGTDFAGRPTTNRTELSDRHKHSIVWQTYTPNLQFLRKHVQRFMKAYGSGVSLLEDRCAMEFKILRDNFEDKKCVPFDPYPDIYAAICNIMLLLLLGKRWDHNDETFLKVLEINKLFNQVFGSGESQTLDFLPSRQVYRSDSYVKLQQSLKMRDEFIREQITFLKESGSQSADCIIKSLLEYTESRHSAHDVTEDTVKEVFTNLLLAGTDTTATALTCLLLILVNYPNVQRKLHEEIDHVIMRDRLPSLSDRQNMPYMEACLLELLRFISHVPLAVPHATICDTEVQGFQIPANTTICINLWSLHHDDKFWEQPWDFSPERFLDESGKLQAPGQHNRRRLLVFGAGRRVCLGETLAKNRLFLFASAICQNFRFEPEDGAAPPNVDPRDFSVGLVLHPERFKIKAFPR